MDTIYDRVKEILERYVKTARGFKTVYYGDPGAIPQSNLPALYVAPVKSRLVAKGTSSDEIKTTISIGLVLNQVEGYAQNPYDENSQTRDLVQAVLEYDSTGTLKTDTVIGAMRAELQADESVLFTDLFDAEYGMSDTRGFKSLEALVTFEATLRKSRP
jgi:hypothetical protein